MTAVQPDQLSHVWSPPGPGQHCTRCYVSAVDAMTRARCRDCVPAERAQPVGADEIQATTDKTVADLDDTGYCPYRDGNGFPCELSSGHAGQHLVID